MLPIWNLRLQRFGDYTEEEEMQRIELKNWNTISVLIVLILKIFMPPSSFNFCHDCLQFDGAFQNICIAGKNTKNALNITL